MAVPEGYTEVGLIGLVNKGNYDPLTEYSKYNFVYYQGSTYLYINELPQSGVTPSDDGVTWQYMSRGMMMDNTPTQGSPNAVTSGGIYDSERALKTEIQNEQTAATTKATDTNNVLGQGTVTNATNVQALLDNVTDKDTNPTKDSAKTVISGGVYSADKATREMIAPVEENATSSAPYAIGEQLIFNGVLCEATSAISIGDTLAMGTNLSTANKITNRDSTPTANSTKLVTSGGVYSADNQIRENIANVETSPSTHAYAVGKQLIFNGLLCKVTSAISVGDTLAVGTNLALSDNVVEQIYSLNQGLTNSLADMNNVLGAKNLVPNNAVSQTMNGITFTVNSDGSVTVNGTASVTTYLNVGNNIKLDNIAYTLTGCPEGGGAEKYEFQMRSTESDSSQWQFFVEYGNGITFPADPNRNYSCFIGIQNGQTVSNLTFYPMLRPASIQDDTYVPYSMTNREMTPYVQAISNPNLLDNPWFTVNQRGQSSYTDPGNGKYTVDRWKIYNYNTLTVSSNGVSSIELAQYFEEDRVKPLLGKTVTLSILFQDGRIRYSSGQLPNAFPSVDTAYIETNVGDNTWIYISLSSSKLLQVQIRNWSDQVIDVRAVKLELGTVSTLAMDTVPNYQQELAKCQRYFVRFNPTDSYTAFGAGIYSSNHVFAEVTLPTVLRAKPSVSFSSVRAHSYGRNDVSVSSITVNNYINNIVSLKCAVQSGANFVNGDYCEIQLDVNDYLNLSCEL